MKSKSAEKVKLKSFDDLFGTDTVAGAGETVTSVPLSQLHTFKDHPFRVLDDEKMQETVDSVKRYGVLIPGIVRPHPENGYEVVAGHRRWRACELAGLEEMPVLIRTLNDDEATIIMVDSNIQRENIPPSEKAKAFKMKLDAIRRKAGRPSKENCTQVGHNFDGKKSIQIVADEAGESRSQVQRYIRLNELTPQLQQMVDDKKIALTPAVEISYLKPEEQKLLVETINSEQTTPSLSQAQRMKKLSQSGDLNEDTMLNIMSEEKKPEVDKIVLTTNTLRKYFPRSYTPRQMENTILKLLEAWTKKRQRSQER